MDIHEIVDQYCQAWISKNGDLSTVPLADDYVFQSPVTHIEGADAYREAALEAGRVITKFDVRHFFVDEPLACGIIDWQMAPMPAPLAAAVVLEIRDGRLVRTEVIFDTQDFFGW
jgi:hypothetical protein